MIQAGFSFIAERGISRDRIQEILDEADGGDIDSQLVQAELDALGSELDDTENLLDPE